MTKIEWPTKNTVCDCVCVGALFCPVSALTFESLELETSFLV